tara:strand:- start:169 stop:384 length:216 start_codon:yes stop_codon:yes gene_type:complete
MHDHPQVIGMYPEILIVVVTHPLQNGGGLLLRLLFGQLAAQLPLMEILEDAQPGLNKVLVFIARPSSSVLW